MKHLLNFNEGMFDIEQFDLRVVQSILDLNNSPEFVEAGISLSIHQVERPTKIAVKDIFRIGLSKGYAQKVKNLYFFNINYTTRLRIARISFKKLLTIYKKPDDMYGYSIWLNKPESIIRDVDVLKNEFVSISKEYLTRSIKNSIITDYGQTLRSQTEMEEKVRRDSENQARKKQAADEARSKHLLEVEKAKEAAAKAAVELKEKQNAFLKMFSEQSILDEFSNVFDLCRGYRIVDKINIQSKSIKILLLFDDVVTSVNTSNDKRHFIKMTEKTNSILSELMSTSERLAEKNIELTYTPFIGETQQRGLSIILRFNNPFIKAASLKKAHR